MIIGILFCWDRCQLIDHLFQNQSNMTFTPVRCAIKLSNCVCDREPSRTLFDQRLYSECILAFGRGEEKYTQSCQINLASQNLY